MNLQDLGEIIVGVRAQHALLHNVGDWSGYGRRHELVAMDAGRVELWVNVTQVERARHWNDYLIEYRATVRIMLSSSTSEPGSYITIWSSTRRSTTADEAVGCLLSKACRELSNMHQLAQLIEEDP